MTMMNEDVRVNVCQQEIVKLDLQIKALIHDICECTGPREFHQQLNQDVGEKITQAKSRIEELERLASEQDKEDDRISLLGDVENHRKHLHSTQCILRKANLAAQTTIETREKDLLFSRKSEMRQRGHSNKDALAKAASDITADLMSITRVIATQVKTSEETVNSLVSSSRQISDTRQELNMQSAHVQSSRKLLSKYGRRECTDRMLIFFALAFFFATVLYVVKKRVFSSAADDVVVM